MFFRSLKQEIEITNLKIEKQILNEEIFVSSGLQNIIHAVLIAEDRRYLFHIGIDTISILRAILKTFLGIRLEGASTIEQQLIRTIRKRYEITINRKISECILAIFISKKYKKLELILLYLNLAYFGWKANGLKQAAKRMNIDIHTASRNDAAKIAAMLKLPMPSKPSANYTSKYKRRVSYILDSWDELGDIDDRFIKLATKHAVILS